LFEEKAGSTVEGHTQCRPRWKEGKNVDRIDRIDSNKKHTRFADSGNNTPELGKEQPPREEKLGHSSDHRGLQTVKEDEIL
jgi:hypothetical protein